MAPWFAILALWILAPLAAAIEESWSGLVTIVESINGPAASSGDQKELEHFAHTIEDRLKQARAMLTTCPPMIARVIREDIGFYEAELERVVAARGGALTIGRTYYIIKGDRMLLVADGARLLIDRVSGDATGQVEGHPISRKLPPIPDAPAIDDQPNGQDMLGYPTKHVVRRARGKSYAIDVALNLPNPYAIGLIEGGQDNDLIHELSELPGLPMMVSEIGGDAVRSLCVVRVDRHEVADMVFQAP
ncbi:MAG: hypothetical protein H0W83_09910 [Planctomycetes bacterium]|nr:hypothetical protein [Planctomycetota bacterium]